ncbi:MAG: tRNA lysidine(34) synthetase TilS [Holosporales bacterium]|jgi:tRNA(Ile)-lysidine synthase|nr:tRNA lysidine(34) synthetase TilS [Holosporales bacterium]
MFSLKEFTKIIQIFPYKNKFAIGVSGGADSMALTLLFNEFLLNTLGSNENLIAVTVDHRLRPESRDEAEQVHLWLSKYKMNHKVLTWEHAPLASQIEEASRQARYQLLTGFCKENGITALYTAHHAGDQTETFLMRLKRGASLTGLCSIRPISYLNQIQIIRPLLEIPQEDLKEILQQYFKQDYINDSSNEDEKFERVFIRKSWMVLEEIGLKKQAVISSIKYLQNLENQLQDLAKKAIKDYIQKENGIIKFSVELTKTQIPQVVKMVLSNVFLQVCENKTPCSQGILDRLYEKITKRDFRAATARGCIIRKKSGFLEILKENRPLKTSNRPP